MNFFDEYTKASLEKKYAEKLKNCIHFIKKCGVPIRTDVPFEFYYAFNMPLISGMKAYPILDGKKGRYCNGKIYIADWTMEQEKRHMVKVVLHELLHEANPKDTEKTVRIKTEKYMKQITSNYYWGLSW